MKVTEDELVAMEALAGAVSTGDRWARLCAEFRSIRQAIRDHRDSCGHDRCWLNDRELYQVLGEPIPDPSMPERAKFLEGCRAYVDGQPDPIPEGRACARCLGSHIYELAGRARLCKPHELVRVAARQDP